MGKGKNSVSNIVFSIIAFIFGSGLLYAFILVNNIKTVNDIYQTAVVKSKEVQACYDEAFATGTISCSLNLRVGANIETREEFEQWKLENNITHLDFDEFKAKQKDKANSSDDNSKSDETRDNSGTNSDNDTNNGDYDSSNDKPASSDKPGYKHMAASNIGKKEILNKLNNLNVVDSYNKNSGYSRTEWKHWISVSGCWDSREEVLYKQGSDVDFLDKSKTLTTDKDKACYINSGVWEDPYSDLVLEKPSQVDIDHIVPLKAAAEAGGYAWDRDKKQQYANDFDVLIISSSKENRTKGAKTPSEWMPPRKDAHCEYAKAYTFILDKYDLNITKADKDVLETALIACEV